MVLIACTTPVAAYLGVLTANRNTRAGTVELETRERRRQNLDTLHKAVEWSTSDNEAVSGRDRHPR